MGKHILNHLLGLLLLITILFLHLLVNQEGMLLLFVGVLICFLLSHDLSFQTNPLTLRSSAFSGCSRL